MSRFARYWQQWLGTWQKKALAVILLWLVGFSVDWEYDRVSPLGTRLRLVERVHLDRRAYSGIVESTGSFFLPIPMSQPRVMTRRVLAGDTLIWQATPRERGLHRAYQPVVSPDGATLLLWYMSPELPWELVRVADRRSIPLAPPFGRDSVPHYEDQYLLAFSHWSPDSRVAYAAKQGSMSAVFLEVWAIDAATGRSELVQRCETPATEGWQGTACGQHLRAWPMKDHER